MPESRRRPWSFQRPGKDQQQISRPKFRVLFRVKGSKLIDFHAVQKPDESLDSSTGSAKIEKAAVRNKYKSCCFGCKTAA